MEGPKIVQRGKVISLSHSIYYLGDCFLIEKVTSRSTYKQWTRNDRIGAPHAEFRGTEREEKEIIYKCSSLGPRNNDNKV